MSCGSCSSGACGTGSKPLGCNSNGGCTTGSCNKLVVFDWLSGMEIQSSTHERIVEVWFKSTRKDFFRYNEEMLPSVGDTVIVSSSPGYDIGSVSLTGELVSVQMKKKGVSPRNNLSRIQRLATQEDIDKWQSFREKEKDCMIKARKMAKEFNLEMKISDVEYQADGTKATFFYTSEGRVDFRELIKKFASSFKVRVEMKQIGTRQEAGRVGGIGSCGRELCCSSWLSDFRSVSTSAARYQQLAINPIKLAGQCGKLKCCLNYELDTYMDALKDFPKGDIKLKTKKGLAFLQKTDIFKRMLWFSYTDEPAVFLPVTLDRVKEIMELNLESKKPDDLTDYNLVTKTPEKLPDFENVVGQDDLHRFDNRENKNRNRKKRRPKRGAKKPQGQGQGQKQNQPQGKNTGGQNKGANSNKPRPKNKNRSNNKPRTQGNNPQGNSQKSNNQKSNKKS